MNGIHLVAPEEYEEFSDEDLERAAPRCTDSANADAFLLRHGEGYRYVVEWGRWLAWNGQKWRDTGAQGRVIHAAMLSARTDYAIVKVVIGELRERLRKLLLEQKADLAKDVEEQIKIKTVLLKWHEQSQNASRLNACAALLATRLTITVAELDAHPWLLNVANGTVDLRTGERRDHRRDDYLTQMTPIEWDEHATCPTWRAFLNQAMGGDTLLVLYLQRLVGYSITGLTTEQVLLFLYGSGSNGKSTFLTAVKEMMGEYACAAPRDLLMVQKAPKHETEIARLHGKRLATGAEVGDGQRFDEAKVKDLTGSDVMSARRMNEDFWDYVPTHKLWLAGNYKPTIIGADLGIWRRVRLVPWTVTIADGDMDKDLPAKLAAELPGILRWAVEGCTEWRRCGLEEPPAVLAATEEYRSESDVLGAFLREICVIDATATVSRSTLRERYERWSKDAGHEPVGGRRLAARLREHRVTECDVRESGIHRRGWRGVRPATEQELFARSEPASNTRLS